MRESKCNTYNTEVNLYNLKVASANADQFVDFLLPQLFSTKFYNFFERWLDECYEQIQAGLRSSNYGSLFQYTSLVILYM